ncbi:hypothetical protein FAI41_02850 [Acetobacteraceae bacterium]|nr:hypothetical protein FAI41_02850 [Acetobacteraceae bacterium]
MSDNWGFGPRIPNLNKKIAARLSVKRLIENKLGLKMPRGYGWLRDPKKALYNRYYYRKNKLWGMLFQTLLNFLTKTRR